MSTSFRWTAVLKWIGLTFGALILVVVVCLALFDWNRLRGPISKIASEKSGHVVQIQGDLDVRPFSLTPSVSVAGLKVGDFADIEHIRLKLALLPLFRGDVVLPELIVDKPHLSLHRTADGHANWEGKKKPQQR